MAPCLSKLKPIRNSCQEIFHPNTSSCTKAILLFSITSFQQSLRLYPVLFLISFLLKRRIPRKNDVYNYVRDCLQSSIFIFFHPFLVIGTVCALRKILGKSYIPTIGLVPGLVCGGLCFFLERSQRRKMVTLYTSNLAAETAFRMLESRGYVKRLKNAEVILLSLALSGYAYLLKSRSSEKDLILSGLRFLLGNGETSPRKNQKSEHDSLVQHIVNTMKTKFPKLFDSPKHGSCEHEHGCLPFIVLGFLRTFVIGYVLSSLTKIPKLRKNPSRVLDALFDKSNLKFGTTLGLFGGMFKLISCLLRWTRNKDCPEHSLAAGFVSGFVFLRDVPSISIPLYLITKLIDIYICKGVEAGYLPYNKAFLPLAYATSISILNHAMLFEPHNMRRSYFQFLHEFSGNRIKGINKNLQDLL